MNINAKHVNSIDYHERMDECFFSPGMTRNDTEIIISHGVMRNDTAIFGMIVRF